MTLGCSILLLLCRHATCLSKPSYRETKPPPHHRHHHQNALLLSLNLSLAAHLPLLFYWQCLTRLDVQLERIFAVTLLLGVAWSKLAPCVLPLCSAVCWLQHAVQSGVAGMIMRCVCNLTCKCWMKGNDQQRSESWNSTALFRHGPLSDLRHRRVSLVSCGILRGFWAFCPCGSNILIGLAVSTNQIFAF